MRRRRRQGDKPYHHGALRSALIAAGETILTRDGPGALSLRAAAREVGVSQAAPYRHFRTVSELLAAIACAGIARLESALAAATPETLHLRGPERQVRLGVAYLGFAMAEPAMFRLAFGEAIGDRAGHEDLVAAIDRVQGLFIVDPHDPAQGLGAWAAAHGLTALVLDRLIDLGQRSGDLSVAPSRAEIVLRRMLAGQLV